VEYAGKGTPYGNLKRIYILDKKDNGLTGTVLDSAGKEISKCSKIDVKDNEVTLYYTSMGNEVSVVLTKKDQDHLTGKGLGTFDVTAERIKQKLQ